MVPTYWEVTVEELEVGESHGGDTRCVCTDGREAERDITEPCNS